MNRLKSWSRDREKKTKRKKQFHHKYINSLYCCGWATGHMGHPAEPRVTGIGRNSARSTAESRTRKVPFSPKILGGQGVPLKSIIINILAAGSAISSRRFSVRHKHTDRWERCHEYTLVLSCQTSGKVGDFLRGRNFHPSDPIAEFVGIPSAKK